MTDKTVLSGFGLVKSTPRTIDLDVASHEPSHIHIARPSRVPRQDNAASRVEPLDEVRDLAAADVTMQAA
jgi:hypothetical protein